MIGFWKRNPGGARGGIRGIRNKLVKKPGFKKEENKLDGGGLPLIFIKG